MVLLRWALEEPRLPFGIILFPWVGFEAHGPLWGLLGWLSVWALVVGPELVPLDGLWKGF